MSKWRFPGVLLAVFALFWLVLAIEPVSREDWLLENLLILAAVPMLIATRNKLRFSDLAYGCFFAFFCFHCIGAHYTYSLVPYDQWWLAITGRTLNAALGFDRNHYDRLVHFLYGALIVVPSLELFVAYAPPRGIWRVLMPVLFVMSHSVIYELIEWFAALLVAPELGQAYLGTQGDPWDAQKDMGLAAAGALFTMLLLRWLPAWRRRFAV